MFKLLEIDNSYAIHNRKTFMIESPDDVANLPISKERDEDDTICSPGSIAYTADLMYVYQLGVDDIWHRI